MTRKSLLSSSSSSADDSKKGVSLDRKDSVSETGFKIKKLKLPRGITNIRIKLNHANPCTIGWRSTQMGKKGQGSILVMAGIRRDIFVWDLNKEDILRYFYTISEYQGLFLDFIRNSRDIKYCLNLCPDF